MSNSFQFGNEFFSLSLVLYFDLFWKYTFKYYSLRVVLFSFFSVVLDNSTFGIHLIFTSSVSVLTQMSFMMWMIVITLRAWMFRMFRISKYKLLLSYTKKNILWQHLWFTFILMIIMFMLSPNSFFFFFCWIHFSPLNYHHNFTDSCCCC